MLANAEERDAGSHDQARTVGAAAAKTRGLAVPLTLPSEVLVARGLLIGVDCAVHSELMWLTELVLAPGA